MKKSKLKFIIKKAMKQYYDKGLYMTGYNVQNRLLKAIDLEYAKYAKKHK